MLTSSPTTMPLSHCQGDRDSLEPASFCLSQAVSVSVYVNLSVSLFLLLSLVHTFSQVVPSAQNTFPFPSLLLLTLYFLFFLMIFLPDFHFKPAILKALF